MSLKTDQWNVYTIEPAESVDECLNWDHIVLAPGIHDLGKLRHNLHFVVVEDTSVPWLKSQFQLLDGIRSWLEAPVIPFPSMRFLYSSKQGIWARDSPGLRNCLRNFVFASSLDHFCMLALERVFLDKDIRV